MRTYVAFVGADYYPAGGFDDIHSVFVAESDQAAIREWDALGWPPGPFGAADWWQLVRVDGDTVAVIAAGQDGERDTSDGLPAPRSGLTKVVG